MEMLPPLSSPPGLQPHRALSFCSAAHSGCVLIPFFTGSGGSSLRVVRSPLSPPHKVWHVARIHRSGERVAEAQDTPMRDRSTALEPTRRVQRTT